MYCCFRITVFYGVRAWSCCHLANGNKHVPRYLSMSLVFKNFMMQPSVLNNFFQNYNILPRSGVTAESLQAGSENMPNFVTFWPIL